MKSNFYGLRGKQVSLILVALTCTTILVWAWEKTPILTTFLPPRGDWLQVSPDVQTSMNLGSSLSQSPKASTKDISTISVDETIQGTENDLAATPPPLDVSNSTPDTVDLSYDSKANSTKEKGELDETVQGTESDRATIAPDDAKTNPTEEEDALKGHEGEEVREKDKVESKNGGPTLDPSTFIESVANISQGNHSNGGSGEDYIVPMSSSHLNSTGSGKDKKTASLVKKGEACDYSEGTWVVDERRPLYSGYSCKQWLSAMWACRLTQRMNFDYEKLRWQPKHCQMEEFDGEKFLKRMKGKTIAFVGDSLGRQQFQSLMCMITGGAGRLDVMDVGKEYGLVKPRGSIRPDGWAYRFPETNTTILYYWSASLCNLQPIDPNNPSTEIAMHLDRPPSFLQRYIAGFDVLVLNTGHHWNRGKINGNRWVMHVDGKPNINKKIAQIWQARNFTMRSIVKWVDSQLLKYPKLKAFYRTISPRHFVGGDWNTGGGCNNETPMSIGKEVVHDDSTDISAWSATRGTKVKLLSITGPSQVRDEGHISKFSIKGTPGVQDCLHWCLPGVPDTWNEILAAQI